MVGPLREARAEAGERLCVVVGAQSPLENMSLGQLEQLFKNRAGDVRGRALIPLNHPALTTYRVGFDRAVLGMEPAEVADYWIDRKKKREAGPPRSVPSISTLRRVLARLPEAVGYLPRRQLTNQVRVLRIDGKYPEAAGYPIVLAE
jgi:hypothetical protein